MLSAVFRTVRNIVVVIIIIIIIIIKRHELVLNRPKSQQNIFWFHSTQQYVILMTSFVQINLHQIIFTEIKIRCMQYN